MRIAERLNSGKQFLSLEFFPPKNSSDWPAFFNVVDSLKILQPLFVSVTYGAGGSTSDNTLAIVTRLKQEFSLEPMAHLTCVGATEKSILSFLEDLKAVGVDNVLALRGDPPQDPGFVLPESKDFVFASDLVTFIRKHYPSMGIGVAGYPEGHPEAASLEKDLQFLKHKVDQGGDFVVSQLFFDNDYYWDFVQRARDLGIEKPIVPGVMPIFSLKVIKKVVSLCGATVPAQLLRELEAADAQGGADAVQALGIRHARSQILGLLKGGAPGVHLYTLNRDDACLELLEGIF
ncbi:MAG: methylenetetrahydrofolate reductase [NAD(P)H] [Syntrophobacterales bacterium]|nr:MAG: methylenetetrahydrofolate reductase [NAD(P)H] [Syntrophobacterales bacterium]